MASKATAKKTTVKINSSKSSSGGTVPCNICKGTGRLQAGYNKKKK